MSYQLNLKYFNSFVLRKVVKNGDDQSGSWPSLPWEPNIINSNGVVLPYPIFPWGTIGEDSIDLAVATPNWYLEESRIKGGFNNSIMELGVRAYAVNKNANKSDRGSSLIFSGVYNNRTGINNTNVFSISESIIKDADPIHGSIQKLYAEDTNLLVLQENKVHKALINKNTIYSGEQGAQETAGPSSVIGQLVPYLGEYGISRNPESFAVFGYRKYFADKDRSAILRLSRDGITEISAYGMRDYFRKNLAAISDNLNKREVSKDSSMTAGTYTQLTMSDITGIDIGAQVEIEYSLSGIAITNSIVIGIVNSTTLNISPGYTINAAPDTVESIRFITFRRDKVYGGWDTHNKNYTLSMQTSPRSFSTTADSFDTLSFDENISGWTSFYSYKPISIGNLKNKYYTFIDNKIYEHYAVVGGDNYCKFYGATTPDEASVKIVFNPSPSIKKNFNTVSYEGDNGWEVTSIESSKQGMDGTSIYFDQTNPIKSYDEGLYIENGDNKRAGFNRKENRYVANVINNSAPRPGEIIYGGGMSGVKGYFATVTFKIDESTDIGGMKELYSVSSNYIVSSY